jgi:hypothetical protein
VRLSRWPCSRHSPTIHGDRSGHVQRAESRNRLRCRLWCRLNREDSPRRGQRGTGWWSVWPDLRVPCVAGALDLPDDSVVARLEHSPPRLDETMRFAVAIRVGAAASELNKPLQ